ncbi:hypothetical protein BD410DRAFT_748030 [Rickenella mellea]|uniref:Uncharacterized protein n=1 Tax=Rickenella mellea TaxID=50990 RepID=A0A4Y7Q693_9AGAM|nr:hypothetical protein BD410DRAFT_748030 [Rickenella mellea]
MDFPPTRVLASPPPLKRRRRTATSVFAGDFDPRPPRDVLTSLLNGVGPYKLVEKDEMTRRAEKRERKEREREKKRQAMAMKKEVAAVAGPSNKPSIAGSASGRSTPTRGTPTVNSSTSSFWRARGPVVTMTRSVSPSPPPELSSQPPTPGPSISSSTSHTSSKRPHTPDDDEIFNIPTTPPAAPPKPVKQPRQRVPAKKGWKGWVEGSPPPSDKLINLDSAPIMTERKTRSGKHFDAISQGQEGWI